MLRRSAYDQWIAELCRDAEESALERDRLKAKLEGLRENHCPPPRRREEPTPERPT